MLRESNVDAETCRETKPRARATFGRSGAGKRLAGRLAVVALLQTAASVAPAPGAARLESRVARFELEPTGQVRSSRVLASGGLQPFGRSGPAGTLVLDGRTVPDVVLDLSRLDRSRVIHGLLEGPGLRLVARGVGTLANAGLEKKLTVEIDDALPHLALIQASYRNTGARALLLERLRLHPYETAGFGMTMPWSFHGASEQPGEDAVVALTPGLARANRFNVSTAKGRGGGLPLVAFWDATQGLALGGLDHGAAAMAWPVQVRGDGTAETALVLEPVRLLQPGDSYTTPLTFVAAFSGDYYEALRLYSDALRRTGWGPARPAEAAYEPSWCSWGYDRNVSAAHMNAIVPKLRQLGLRWATLDDGWFGTYGDWEPRPGRFDERALRDLTARYHDAGLRLTLWWLPLAVEYGHPRADGSRRDTALLAREHPEWLVLDSQGKPAMGPRRLAFVCPALPEVQAHTRKLVRRFIGEWGFDGHKLDNVFSMPDCHNAAHRHATPHESRRALSVVYSQILEETRRLKPDSVTQICSCATLPNVAWLHLQDQPSVADPSAAPQLRRRIKAFKALLGDEAPVSGDHVELAERFPGEGERAALGRDFASTLGTGGVPGTRFVWPRTRRTPADVLLTDEKQAHFDKWLRLYREKRLSSGRFRNLYVHGFDWPEAYAVEQSGRMHYAFFAPDAGVPWQGTLELRGLGLGRFRVIDYVNARELGQVEGPTGRLALSFREHLLLEAVPLRR